MFPMTGEQQAQWRFTVDLFTASWFSPSPAFCLPSHASGHGCVTSIPIVIFVFTTIGSGRTAHLNGFFTLTFSGALDPIGLVLAYPSLNALAGVIAGFLTAWFFNLYARLSRGIAVEFNQDRNQRHHSRNVQDRREPSDVNRRD